jgi:hypothetical protein
MLVAVRRFGVRETWWRRERLLFFLLVDFVDLVDLAVDFVDLVDFEVDLLTRLVFALLLLLVALLLLLAPATEGNGPTAPTAKVSERTNGRDLRRIESTGTDLCAGMA